MKKNLKLALILCLAMAMPVAFTSCSKDDDNPVDDPVGDVLPLGNGTNEFEIKVNTTLSYPNIYDLKGFVYVTNGATLTIEPGVIIRGDKETKGTLIIERGAKIEAAGTLERPIIFTSSKAPGQRKNGDWGGVIICGRAYNNLGTQTIEGGPRTVHGGLDDDDDSGTFRYVRIEFAGMPYNNDPSANSEINGLTLGSVGLGTEIDHVQVSYSGDDSFEWFGGTANARYLVAYSGTDDDFDTDNGFNGKIQYVLGLRDPKIADQSASNGFESDNNASSSTTARFTSPVFANVSLFGPVTNPGAYTEQGGVNGINNGAKIAHFNTGLHLRRNTQLNIFNSLVAGWPIGLIIETGGDPNSQVSATAGNLNVTNVVLAGMIKNFQDKQVAPSNSDPLTIFNNADNGTFTTAYFNRAGGNNSVVANISSLGLTGNPQALNTAYSSTPTPGTLMATGAAWTNLKVSSGFDKVAYIGAFAPAPAALWTAEWTEFNPQQAIYW